MPSGSISVAGKAQPLVGVSTFRKGLSVQNNSDAELRILHGGVDAGATSGIRIPAGEYYETPTNRFAGGSWSVWGGTLGQAYAWEEW